MDFKESMILNRVTKLLLINIEIKLIYLSNQGFKKFFFLSHPIPIPYGIHGHKRGKPQQHCLYPARATFNVLEMKTTSRSANNKDHHFVAIGPIVNS